MNKKILSAQDLVLAAIAALSLVLIYNFKTIGARFSLYSSGEILIFAAEISIAFLTTFLFFLICSFNKKFFKTILVLMFLFSTISLYILNKFGIIFDEIMLANAFTSVGHVGEVVDYSLAIYFLFGTILPAVLIIKINLQSTKIKTKLIVLIIAAISYGAIYSGFNKGSTSKIFNSYSPINYFGSTYKFYQRFHSGLKQAKLRVDLDKFYNFDYDKKLDDLNVVLIIGESLRADHLHLNGYWRQTTPNLEKINNLLHYQIRASFNTTTPSVTSILSSRTKAEFIDIPPEKSIISVFKNLGFKTYWYSAQSSKEFTNGMLNIMAAETDNYFFIDKLQTTLKANQKVYDENLLPFFDQALSSGGNKFIILHSFGSHIRFDERSPENFKIFKPECIGLPSSCPKDLVANSYDNSVVYTDHFVASAINRLKNTNSILFYVSDHGVFLGENNVYANGNSDQIDDKVHIVPMLIYMTDSVLKNKDYQQKFNSAKAKINAKNLSHDNLFDSIIDCSAIKSNILQRNLSLCQESKIRSK
ncbi:MAG: sulfatase-like hydrolase/transferase [Pseudomonadota bacterium]